MLGSLSGFESDDEMRRVAEYIHLGYGSNGVLLRMDICAKSLPLKFLYMSMSPDTLNVLRLRYPNVPDLHWLHKIYGKEKVAVTHVLNSITNSSGSGSNSLSCADNL